MFDLEVFVGPALVLLGMFIGLLGFIIWGARAVRESVPPMELAPTVDGLAANADMEAAEPLAELALPDFEHDEETDEAEPVQNMERTAEFSQPLATASTVASFSQSFWEGQEVPSPAQSDYNEAIDRIKADLNAADAAEFNKDALEADPDALAAANVLEALRYGVNPQAQAPEASKNAVDLPAPPAENLAEPEEEVLINPDDTAHAEAVEAVEADENNELTRVITPEQAAAILQDEEAQEYKAEPLPEDNEATRLLQVSDNLPEMETAAELEPEALEETRMHRLPEESAAKPEAQPAAEAAEEANSPKLQRIPPGVASNFGFINNQAAGLASATQARQMPDLSALAAEDAGDTLLPEAPIPFGPKMAWLAIPGFKPSEVIAELRLDNVQSANWTIGLREAYADNNLVFVSPSLGGWVMVIGKTLWERADMNRSAENIPWLRDICRKFGNACFFSTMRGLGNHGWVGIRDGQIARAYGYSTELQELIWLVGEPTEEEIAINPAFITEMREKYQPGFRPVIPDEKLVLAVAAAWSVDPGFRRRQYPADYGYLGYIN